MGRFDFKTRSGQISAIIQTQSGTSTDADAQAFYDRVSAAGGTLTTTEKDAVNILVLSLKSANVWTLMKAIYPMVGASAAACSQNLKSSSFTGTFTSGWTFSANGVTPNGTNAFMDTAVIPNVDLLQNSLHISVYIRGTNSGNQYYIGGRGTNTLSNIYILNYGFAAVNNGDASATSVTGQVGLFTNIRNSATTILQYKNSTLLSTITAASSTLGNKKIYLSAFNSDGVASNFSNNQNAFASIGEGLNTTQQLDFYNSVQTFQSVLSRNL